MLMCMLRQKHTQTYERINTWLLRQTRRRQIHTQTFQFEVDCNEIPYKQEEKTTNQIAVKLQITN